MKGRLTGFPDSEFTSMARVSNAVWPAASSGVQVVAHRFYFERLAGTKCLHKFVDIYFERCNVGRSPTIVIDLDTYSHELSSCVFALIQGSP